MGKTMTALPAVSTRNPTAYPIYAVAGLRVLPQLRVNLRVNCGSAGISHRHRKRCGRFHGIQARQRRRREVSARRGGLS